MMNLTWSSAAQAHSVLSSLTYREHWMYSLPLTVGMCHLNWMQSVPTALSKAALFSVWDCPSRTDVFHLCEIVLNSASEFGLGSNTVNSAKQVLYVFVFVHTVCACKRPNLNQWNLKNAIICVNLNIFKLWVLNFYYAGFRLKNNVWTHKNNHSNHHLWPARTVWVCLNLQRSCSLPVFSYFLCLFLCFQDVFLMSVIQEKDSWFLGIWQQNDVWCVLCCSVPVPVREASRGEWWSVRMPMDAATATAMRGSNQPSLRAVTRDPALCGTTVFGERWGSI